MDADEIINQPRKAAPMPDEMPAPAKDEPTPPTIWYFNGIKLETPGDMNMGLWKLLVAYVDILKPEKKEKPRFENR